MSTATLTGLLDYLYGTLTPSDMRWVGDHLIERATKTEHAPKPYTMEELNAMLDAAEADIAAGRTTPHEESMRRWQEKIAYKDRAVNMLVHSPNLGSIDPLFGDRSVAYRSIIINGLSKMVYRACNDVIYIVAFWDTRQEPAAQAEQVKE